MSDTSSQAGRIPFPLAFLGLALFFGAMRFEGFRPLGARFVGFALPVATVWAAQSKLVDTHPALRRAALALGRRGARRGRASGRAVLLGFHSLSPHPETYRLVLVAVGLGAVVLEGLAARRSLRVRLAAWFGIALGFAGYLAGVEPGLPEAATRRGLRRVAGGALGGRARRARSRRRRRASRSTTRERSEDADRA